MSRLISVFAVFILFSIVSCREKLTTVRIEYNHENSKNKISDNYASMLFDSVSITIDDRRNFQMLQWSSAWEKYYLIADKSDQYLIVSNESGNYWYDKENIYQRLEGFYFPIEVKRKEQNLTEIIGVKAKNSICMVDSLNGNMIYASEFKNFLPFFEKIPGIPLDFYLNVCGEKSRFVACRSSKMKFIEVFVPYDNMSFSEKSYEQPKTESVNVYGYVEEYFSEEELPFTSISIFADGKFRDVVFSDCTGYYDFFLDYDQEYTMNFFGNGMVTKKIRVDLRGIPSEENEEGFEMSVDGSLFSDTLKGDFSILEKPIAIAAYDSTSATIEFDFPYTEKMHIELNKILEKK